jgi:hypothetical protein
MVGATRIKLFQVTATGFPFEKSSKELKFNITFVPEDVIVSLIAAGNISLNPQLPNANEMPFVISHMYDVCDTAELACPFPANGVLYVHTFVQSFYQRVPFLEPVVANLTLSFDGPYGVLTEIDVKIKAALEVFDQSGTTILCVVGQTPPVP